MSTVILALIVQALLLEELFDILVYDENPADEKKRVITPADIIRSTNMLNQRKKKTESRKLTRQIAWSKISHKRPIDSEQQLVPEKMVVSEKQSIPKICESCYFTTSHKRLGSSVWCRCVNPSRAFSGSKLGTQWIPSSIGLPCWKPKTENN